MPRVSVVGEGSLTESRPGRSSVGAVVDVLSFPSELRSVSSLRSFERNRSRYMADKNQALVGILLPYLVLDARNLLNVHTGQFA